MNDIICGDSKIELKKIKSNSVDLIATDPPYGYFINNKEWDFKLPDQSIFKECFRVLKDGSFLFTMTSVRQDLFASMILMLKKSGFNIAFSSLEWVYLQGRSKAIDISSEIDKRGGIDLCNVGLVIKKKRLEIGLSSNDLAVLVTGKKTGIVRNWEDGRAYPSVDNFNKLKDILSLDEYDYIDDLRVKTGNKKHSSSVEFMSFEGRQVERRHLPIMEVTSDKAMSFIGSKGGYQPKPSRENILVAMKPMKHSSFTGQALDNQKGITWLGDVCIPVIDGVNTPSNLIVSDDAMGDISKHFDLDEWWANRVESFSDEIKEILPFIYLPKNQKKKIGNTHPTIKPIKLFQYLIVMGSRKGDLVLDPFCGSGTTCVASVLEHRNYIGIDLEEEYCKIARNRLCNMQLNLF